MPSEKGPSRGERGERDETSRRSSSGTSAEGGGGETPSPLSYVVAAVSGAIVLALLVYLTVQALAPLEPASISAEPVAGETERGEGGYSVPVDVRNAGGATAKEILIESTLEDAAGREPAVSETTIDYLAGNERKRVYAVFDRDPAAGKVTSRVLSYQEP